MDGKKDKDNVYLTVSVLPFHPTAPDIMSWRCHSKRRHETSAPLFLDNQVLQDNESHGFMLSTSKIEDKVHMKVRE